MEEAVSGSGHPSQGLNHVGRRSATSGGETTDRPIPAPERVFGMVLDAHAEPRWVSTQAVPSGR
jgi:hypothetical protein